MNWTRGDGLVIVAAVVAAGGAAILADPLISASSDLLSSWKTRLALDAHWPSLVEEGGLLAGERGDVVLVEFGDYQCEGCVLLERKLRTATDGAAATRGVVYRHFPLRGHEYAEEAALASICAEFQDAFIPMHRQLFTIPEWSWEPDWTFEARAAGVPDLDEFESCLEGAEAAERLERDMELANILGLMGTPSLLTRQTMHFGQPLSGDWLSNLLVTRRSQ